MKKKVSVIEDGACLFRSIATVLFFKEYGINIGGGAYFGEEVNIQELTHNIMTRWVRLLITYTMYHGKYMNVDTMIGPTSMRKIMHRLLLLIKAKGLYYTFESAREKRIIFRSFVYAIPLKGKSNGQHFCFEDDISLDIISMSGRREGESYKTYCKRMAKLHEWGGAGECYVASHIFHYAINIYKSNRIFQKYVPLKTKGILSVSFSPKYEHYNAIFT